MVWLAIASLVLPLAGCASWPGGETYGPGAIVDASQVETQDTLRPAPRLIASTRMTHTQAEALIARAITEHEIRRP